MPGARWARDVEKHRNVHRAQSGELLTGGSEVGARTARWARDVEKHRNDIEHRAVSF